MSKDANGLPPRCLSVSRVAERMDVCVATVYRWIAQGYLPAKRIGGTYRIPVSALVDLPDVLNGKKRG